MNATPIHGTPALLINVARERVLVVADLHLGIEAELASGGVGLPSQMPRIKERLIELIHRQDPDRLIFLGDVKHNVPVAAWQEWRELPEFFADLAKLTRVEIVPGNHDGDIEGMVPSGVVIHGPKGMVLGRRRRVGLIHGHAWPSPKVLKVELLVAAHNHPAVEFRDELGARTIEPVWLRCRIEPKKFPEKLRNAVEGGGPELLVMPAFSELVGGGTVNRAIPEELLGPMFKAGAVRLEEAEVHLLDGTFLGTVAALRELKKDKPI
jgi:putative SbcD/Mre11-related phosphoesterase